MWQIDPTSLRLFVAVCEEGSIGRASEREDITPSAISKRIADIEASIGTALLLRSPRGVTMTPAGETLLRQGRQLIQSVEKLHAELSEFASGVLGHVRVLANVSSIVEFLPEELSSFLKANSQIRIELEERVSTDIVRGIADGVADIGICRDFVNTNNLEVYPYRRDHLSIVVNDAHPFARFERISFADTLDCDYIGLVLNASVDRLINRIAADHGKTVRYRMHVSSFDAAFRLIGEGLAIAVLPQEAVHRYATMFGLRSIPLTDAWASRDFILCVRSADELSPLADRLLNHLLDRSHGIIPPPDA
ncbi:LysR substrate-binding domain-containing protein [Burkholderia diffusa]|uniref:LysR substrate-binding domain-containing protein n=1 Tax=Burkholderia diffusa TaxID=488732 RepID=UPI002ABD927A|nr:LysR substrate-binding domain-containing protein [Burkholderia diffusa]